VRERRAGRARLLRAVMVATVGGLALPGSSGAQTAEFAAGRALATAQGVRTSLTIPGFLLVESVFDGGGPVAQAVLDSAGGAGFASLPYPGETAMAVPGLIAAGGGPALPTYPLYVSATGSQPDQGVSDPAGMYALRAVVSATGATADGRLGSHGQAVVSGSQTHTEVSRVAEAVTATAEAVTEGISVAEGALMIGSVRSRSRTVLRPPASGAGAANLQTTTELVVEGGRAGAFSFSYGPDGLAVNGGAVPIPAGSGLAALNQALAPASVKLGIVRGEDVAGGRSSDVLMVEQQVSLPTGQSGLLRLRFGGTATAVGGSPLAADLGGGVPVEPAPAAPAAPADSIGPVAGEASAHDRPIAAPGLEPGAAALGLADQPAPGFGAPGAGAPAPAVSAVAPGATGRPPPRGLDAAPIGVAAVRVTGLRVAYGALAAVAAALAFGSWCWKKRGAQGP
jgi:hypothetical protein